MKQGCTGRGQYKKRQQLFFIALTLLLLDFLNPGVAGLFSGTEICMAAEQETAQTQNETINGVLEDLDLSQVQKMLDQMLGEESFSMKDMLVSLTKGENVLSKDTVQDLLRSFLFSGMQKEKSLLIRILLLILLAAVFSNFAAVFENGQIGEICFYIVYLLLFILLMDSFSSMSHSLLQTVSWMAEFMRGLAPAYFLTISLSSGSATAAVFYEGILILTWLIQTVIVNILLPGVGMYVLIALLNNLSREEMLGRMAELLDTAVSWGLKTLLGAVVGLQVGGLVAPVIDTLKRSMIGRSAGVLPGVGSAVNMVTELVLTSAVLIRNSLGVVILLAFVAVGAGPVVHYGLLSLLYRFLAAIAQPISDKRIVDSLATMGEGCALLLRALFTAEILCVLDFIIVMSGIGGSG